jgi:hypothetical protein
MLSVHCPRHASRVLLPEGHIRNIQSTDAGIVVDWSCWCGHLGSTRIGRPRRPATDTIT